MFLSNIINSKNINIEQQFKKLLFNQKLFNNKFTKIMFIFFYFKEKNLLLSSIYMSVFMLIYSKYVYMKER